MRRRNPDAGLSSSGSSFVKAVICGPLPAGIVFLENRGIIDVKPPNSKYIPKAL